MEKLKFDSGIREFDLGTGTALRFNPGDPNLYVRFLTAAQKVQAVEQELVQQAETLENSDSGEAVLTLLQNADKKMKEILSWVFENDFEKILGGMNLLAVGKNGQRVIANLFEVLQPVLVAGAQACAKEQTQAAVAKAKARRNRV